MALYADCPKKLVGTSVIFRNEENKILLVKPSYRDDWIFSGGVVDKDESPIHCALREVKEELGVSKILTMISISHFSWDENEIDEMKFMFDGGFFTREDIANIVLPKEELLAFDFFTLKEAMEKVSRIDGVILSKIYPLLGSGEFIYFDKDSLIKFTGK